MTTQKEADSGGGGGSGLMSPGASSPYFSSSVAAALVLAPAKSAPSPFATSPTAAAAAAAAAAGASSTTIAGPTPTKNSSASAAPTSLAAQRAQLLDELQSAHKRELALAEQLGSSTGGSSWAAPEWTCGEGITGPCTLLGSVMSGPNSPARGHRARGSARGVGALDSTPPLRRSLSYQILGGQEKGLEAVKPPHAVSISGGAQEGPNNEYGTAVTPAVAVAAAVAALHRAQRPRRRGLRSRQARRHICRCRRRLPQWGPRASATVSYGSESYGPSASQDCNPSGFGYAHGGSGAGSGSGSGAEEYDGRAAAGKGHGKRHGKAAPLLHPGERSMPYLTG